MKSRGITGFIDIADPEILDKREQYTQALSRHVLFHFYANNPFDYAVCRRYGSENMAIITIRRTLSKANEFFIIPSHPVNRTTPEILPYEKGIEQIRWDILDNEAGRDYQDRDIRQACMAECVMDYTIPAGAFSFIYVSSDQAKRRIDAMPKKTDVSIRINPHMFP